MLNLAAGYHDIDLRFAENLGAASVNLAYSGADNNNTLTNIPASRLFLTDVPYSAWYNAGSITGIADGAAITRWNDNSVNQNHLINVSAAPKLYSNASTQLMNFNAVVQFNEGYVQGVDDPDGLMYGKGGRTIFNVSRSNSNTDQ